MLLAHTTPELHHIVAPDDASWLLLAAGICVVSAVALRHRPGPRAPRSTPILVVAAAALVAGACSSGTSSSGTSSSSTTSMTEEQSTTSEAAEATLDLTTLPLGDDQYSDQPEAGFVYACQTEFAGGGAQAQGPWIDAEAGTWNLLEKVSVPGEVEWPQATWEATVDGDTRMLASLDLPVDHPTGEFPVPEDSEAYQYDRNPNTIVEQETSLAVPVDPALLDEPECIGGEVGIMTTGVLIFSAFDAGGRDAVATEVQDDCDGHPQAGGYYHHHGPSSCVEEIEQTAPDGEHSPLQGYAYDGFGMFGVYGEDGEDGELLASADLDECHGHTHTIEWDGDEVEMFHYHFTPDFPYTLGCFRGEPIDRVLSQGEDRASPGAGAAPGAGSQREAGLLARSPSTTG
jgi:hypothetical protein